MNSDRAGHRAVTVTLSDECDVSRANAVSPDPPITSSFEETRRSGSRLSLIRFDRFPGGCVTYDIKFAKGSPSALLSDVDRALAYTARTRLERHVYGDAGLVLCGRGEACPGS